MEPFFTGQSQLSAFQRKNVVSREVQNDILGTQQINNTFLELGEMCWERLIKGHLSVGKEESM